MLETVSAWGENQNKKGNIPSQVGSAGKSIGAICAANSLKTRTGRGMCRLLRWTTERSTVGSPDDVYEAWRARAQIGRLGRRHAGLDVDVVERCDHPATGVLDQYFLQPRSDDAVGFGAQSGW